MFYPFHSREKVHDCLHSIWVCRSRSFETQTATRRRSKLKHQSSRSNSRVCQRKGVGAEAGLNGKGKERVRRKTGWWGKLNWRKCHENNR